MANLRYLKKEIDYRLEEVVFDCDMAICFQPSKEKEIFEVMQEAVALRNDLFSKAMNPAEPHNRSLVRKHYAALRAEMADAFGKLFEKLSAINEQTTSGRTRPCRRADSFRGAGETAVERRCRIRNDKPLRSERSQRFSFRARKAPSVRFGQGGIRR